MSAIKRAAQPQKGFEELPERRSLSANRAAEPRKNSSRSLSACMAAAIELEETRDLVSALENENVALNERLETEKQRSAILTELDETRKSENDALRSAVAAKNETIAAQDKVIASQDKLAAALKGKRRSPLGRIGDILIGAAIFGVLK